jgi:TctA family transporter
VRPLTVLTAIVLGSAVAITFSLSATAVVYLVLQNKHPQFRAELPWLLGYLAAFVLLSAVAGLTLAGQLRERPWRRWAQATMWALLVGFASLYWATRDIM